MVRRIDPGWNPGLNMVDFTAALRMAEGQKLGEFVRMPLIWAGEGGRMAGLGYIQGLLAIYCGGSS